MGWDVLLCCALANNDSDKDGIGMGVVWRVAWRIRIRSRNEYGKKRDDRWSSGACVCVCKTSPKV